MRKQDQPLHFKPEGEFTGNYLKDVKAVKMNGSKVLKIAKDQEKKKKDHVWMRLGKTAKLVHPDKVQVNLDAGFVRSNSS